MSPFRFAVPVLGLFLVACAADPAGPAEGPGANPYTLSLAGGSGTVTLHPAGERTLEVVLTRREEGPVGQARIHFDLQGDPAAGRIDAQDAVTDGEGVASVRFIAGAPSSAPLRLTASAPGLDAAPVAVAIEVVPLRRLLQAIAGSSTQVSTDGASASTVAGVSSSVGLRVRELDADTGEPIAGDTVAFTLPAAAGSRWSTGVSLTALVQTGQGGQARAFLVTTQAAEGPWQVIARSAAGGPIVTFSVTVQGGGSCTVNAQCPPGQVCAGDPPACRIGGGGCGTCPPGQDCFSGVCQPPGDAGCDPEAPVCAPGQCCDPAALACRDACSESCAPGTHCEAGPACGEGSCVPDETVPDLSGWWLTRHDFRIAEAIPLPVREVFKGLRLIDQTLLGKLTIPGLPRWVQQILDSFVSRLLQQYLPLWLQELVHLSDDLATLLGNLRAEGTLRLSRNGDVAHLRGEEAWTSLVFYWLPLCNGDIGGEPGEPPECARIDVLTTDSGPTDGTAQCKGQLLPAISVQASPFTATVVRQGDRYALAVDQRQVKLTMGKVILILVDQLIALVTGGEDRCIEEMTACRDGGSCLVDCEGLGRDVEEATDGIVDSGTVGQLCGGAVRAWGEIWVEALAQAWPVSADTLDFSGGAGIYGQADDFVCDEGGVPGTCAARLGTAAWDRDLNSPDPGVREGRDGWWSGDFFFRLGHRLPGAWRARRLP